MSSKDRDRSKKHHKATGASVDWKKKRLFHEGETYKFKSPGSGVTPCKWKRIGKHGHSHTVLKYVQRELDTELLRAHALQREERTNEYAESASESVEQNKETPWQKHTRQGPPIKGKRVERTKYGIRVYSVDGKTWWDFCVNDSTTYPGGTAVRLTLPPPRKDGKRWHMAVFDLETMEAIRREFARGKKPDK